MNIFKDFLKWIAAWFSPCPCAFCNPTTDAHFLARGLQISIAQSEDLLKRAEAGQFFAMKTLAKLVKSTPTQALEVAKEIIAEERLRYDHVH